METHSKDEMETFQRLSDQYQPEVEGPLVREKRPMSILMQEYAQADPTYVAKTASLAATHSAYRSVKGDGQCGWRGAVFGYFETLLSLGDVQTIMQEIVRIKTFEDTIRMAGIDYDIVVDMFEFTWELFDKIKQAAEIQSKNENSLMEMFNKETESNYIVYHFKLMTSAYMALRPEQYEPFLEMPLSDYRATRLDPPNQEIDQIGLQALVDAIIAPAGMGLEVSYLDRSQGDVVTPHQFVQNGEQLPNIRLLYRPGHYDMIYKDLRAMRALPARLQQDVMAATPFHGQTVDPSSYIMPTSMMQTPEPSPTDTNYPPHGSQTFRFQDGSFPDMFYYGFRNDAYPMTHAQGSEQQGWKPPLQVTLSPRVATTTPSPTNPLPANVSSDLPSSPQEDRFRMTSVFYDYGRRRQQSIPLESGPLRDDPENRGHYLSADFQPHIWTPDEYDGRS